MTFFYPNFLNQVNFRTLVNPILVLPRWDVRPRCTVLDKSPIIKSKATLFGDKNVSPAICHYVIEGFGEPHSRSFQPYSYIENPLQFLQENPKTSFLLMPIYFFFMKWSVTDPWTILARKPSNWCKCLVMLLFYCLSAGSFLVNDMWLIRWI